MRKVSKDNAHLNNRLKRMDADIEWDQKQKKETKDKLLQHIDKGKSKSKVFNSVKHVASLVALMVLLFIGFQVIPPFITDEDGGQTESWFSALSAYYDKQNGVLGYKEDILEDEVEQLEEKVAMDEKIYTTITFNRPIEEEELVRFVERNNIEVENIKGRTVKKENGLRGTFGIAPRNGDLYDKKILETMIERKSSDFKGFIEVVGFVPNQKLQEMNESHEFVFLADPSVDRHITKRQPQNPAKGLYWELEEEGLTEKAGNP